MKIPDMNWTRDTCPFLKFPGRNCYCLKLEGRNIERALQFCGSDYLHCEHFRERLVSLEGPRAAALTDQEREP